MRKAVLAIAAAILIILPLDAQTNETGAFTLARLKYDGGGDWYNDRSADVNLLKYIGSVTNLPVQPEYTFVEITDDELFSYPFVFMTGHGNVVFSDEEAERLRRYLENGGFLYIDDDYGFDEPIRREMKKVFPNKEFLELPFSHPIYSIFYQFPDGPPKTHEHDKKVPQGFGIFIGDRLAVYYTYEANPSDGWADYTVHKNPEEKRLEALKFGTNIVMYALSY